MSEIDPRQHSAEHILTAVFGHLFDGRIVDSRFKGNKVRCDYEVKTELPLAEIISKAEARTNEIISENREVTFEFVSLAEAKKLCSLHRLPDGITEVRLAKIGPDVITPCRGNHVHNTSEIGTLKIRTFDWATPGIIRLTFVVEN
ncbi:MAG: hypothetical protein AAB373_06240 [Patescibacteria group bacterium]